LAVLADTGFEVMDYLYTPRSNELGSDLVQKFLSIPRTALFALHQDFGVRLLGGYSLLILAR